MASYAALLQDEKWLNKREEILDWDKRVCQNCHNDLYFSNFKKSEIISEESLDDPLFTVLNAGDDRSRDGVYKYSVSFLNEDEHKQRVDFYSAA